MRANDEVVQAELARARADLGDLEAEFAALADPENIALDDEHDSEASTVGFERARVAGLLERARRQVNELESAAQRAEDGSYGYCSSCGREIAAGAAGRSTGHAAMHRLRSLRARTNSSR